MDPIKRPSITHHHIFLFFWNSDWGLFMRRILQFQKITEKDIKDWKSMCPFGICGLLLPFICINCQCHLFFLFAICVSFWNWMNVIAFDDYDYDTLILIKKCKNSLSQWKRQNTQWTSFARQGTVFGIAWNLLVACRLSILFIWHHSSIECNPK